MPSLKELREQAAAKIATLKQQRDEWHKLKSENKPEAELEERKKTIGETRKELDALFVSIDAEQHSSDLDSYISDLEKRSKPGTKPGRDDFDLDLPNQRDRGDESDLPTDLDKSISLQAWAMRAAGKPLQKRHKEAIAKCKRAGISYGKTIEFKSSPTADFRRAQQLFRATHPSMIGGPQFQERAMSSIVGSLGGYAVSQGFVRQLEINQLAFSGVLQVAEVMRTPRGDEMPWPTADDASNEGEQIGQSASLGTSSSTNPTLSRIMFHAHKAHSKAIRVPFELLEDWDAAPSFEQYLNQIMAERLGRHRNRKYTLGTGNSEPMGVITAAALGRTAGSATVVTGDDFLRLIASIDPAYRMGATFMMHDSIWLEVQLLKDGQGQYIHTPGLQAGARDVIRGYSVFVNQHMDSALATTNKVATFGQHSKYKVREVGTVRLKRFDELFGDNDEVGFDALIRHDGNLIDAGTEPVKYLQMA